MTLGVSHGDSIHLHDLSQDRRSCEQKFWQYLWSDCSMSIHPCLESSPKVILLLYKDNKRCVSCPPPRGSQI